MPAKKSNIDAELHYCHCEEDTTRALKKFIDHTDQFQRVVDAFSHLGDLNRIRIFWMLCHTELCTACIADMMDMSSPAIAHHLKLLKEEGLIEGRREGKEVLYRAVSTPQARTLHDAIEAMLTISCPVSKL